MTEVIYGDGQVEYRMPDAVGNLFETRERTDREYGRSGRLLKSKTAEYKYDGFLIEKRVKKVIAPGGADQVGIWRYRWNEAGMLESVLRPDGETVSFTYDALGRRIKKKFKTTTTYWVGDGNKPLHEWKGFDAKEANLDALITWVFEQNSFAPAAKLKGNRSYVITTDHLGTPVQDYNEEGDLIWQRETSYGTHKMLKGDAGFCNYLYQGQTLDVETGLAYNRFRYYDPKQGNYISQDPIGLAGNNPTLYGYVEDPTTEIDTLGWACKKVKVGEEIAPNTTVKRIRRGTNGKAIVIGRGMDDRIIPGAQNIGAEHWTGFDNNLSAEENVANNRKWIEEKITDGYTVIDVCLDPRYKTATGNISLLKGPYYGVETEVAFGTKPVPVK